MAKRRKKACLPRPVITLRKTKTPRGRRAATKPAMVEYTLCATGDEACAAAAAKRGLTTARVRHTGPTDARPSGFDYKSTGKPCSGDRFGVKDPKKCPVQVFWSGGKMAIRLCSKKGEKGKVIQLGTDAKKTRALTEKACRHWAKHLSWDGFERGAKLGSTR